MYDEKEDYIVSTFRRHRSQFINETIDFNLRSGFVLTTCAEENNQLKISQKRFYSNCPLPVNETILNSVYVKARCSRAIASYSHHETVQSGIYIPFR